MVQRYSVKRATQRRLQRGRKATVTANNWGTPKAAVSALWDIQQRGCTAIRIGAVLLRPTLAVPLELLNLQLKVTNLREKAVFALLALLKIPSETNIFLLALIQNVLCQLKLFFHLAKGSVLRSDLITQLRNRFSSVVIIPVQSDV
jgi:hypothetical protein